jgi:hypothetical protein
MYTVTDPFIYLVQQINVCIVIFFYVDNENFPGLMHKRLQNVFWHCVVVSASKTTVF